MVNIAAGAAEATAAMTVVSVFVTIAMFVMTLMPRCTRPVSRFFSQGRTSLSAVSPDYTLNGGRTVA